MNRPQESQQLHRHRSKRPRSGVVRIASLALCAPVALTVVAASPATAFLGEPKSTSNGRSTKPPKPGKPLTTATSTPTSTTTAPAPTPTPTGTTTPTATSTTTTPAPTTTSPTTPTRAADAAGARAPGLAAYPVPAGAVVVAPTGSDTAAGTTAAPVRTIARALVLAPAGGTVVLRAGTYHESVTVESKPVTIQNYPGEAVWLDGSVAIGGWVRDGSTWRKDGWTPRFDATPGFTKGDQDGTSDGWRWVNPAHPMAAHPDQVFVDGSQLRQVQSRDLVTAGTFYLDESTSQLFIGTDPTGKDVRGTTLTKAMSIRTEGSALRGIGIRRFAPSIWHIGAVTVERPHGRVEDVTISDSATIGLGVTAADVVVNRTSVLRSGLLGVHAATADRLHLESSKLNENNWERFNSAPVSGGMKAGRSRGIQVMNSTISDNLGHGYWSDVSVYDTKILNSNLNNNAATGVFLEISARGTVANNLVMGNGAEGIKVNNISDVAIYNNTVVRNARAINLVQDTRRPYNTSYGHDTRYPNDPEMTWLLGPVTVRNNVIGLPNGTANCVLCVEDYGHERTAAQMGIVSNGNVFNRATATTPGWLTVWSRGAEAPNPYVFGNLAAHRSGTGQDTTSLGYDGSVVVSTTGALSGTAQAQAGSVAVALPSSIATLVGQPAGVKHLGAWGR